jgi:hypothetical protein
MPKELFPNLFVAGVSRGGTTTLHRLLSSHPDISSGKAKEQWVYNVEQRYANRHSIFQTQYDQENRVRYFLDSTPHYFSGNLLWSARPGNASISLNESAVDRILNDTPNARFIVTLRHPVDRYLSEYVMNRSKEKPDVERTIARHIRHNLDGKAPGHSDYLYMSRFGTFLEQMIEVAGTDNVKVVFLEEWTQDIPSAMDDLFKWLEVRKPNTFVDNQHENSGSKYRRKARGILGIGPGANSRLAKMLHTLDQHLAGEYRTLGDRVGRLPNYWAEWDAERCASEFVQKLSSRRRIRGHRRG